MGECPVMAKAPVYQGKELRQKAMEILVGEEALELPNHFPVADSLSPAHSSAVQPLVMSADVAEFHEDFEGDARVGDVKVPQPASAEPSG